MDRTGWPVFRCDIGFPLGGSTSAARAARHGRPQKGTYAYTKSGTLCHSAPFHAGRFDDLLAVLALDPKPYWDDQQWVAKALAARGDVDGAIELMEALRSRHAPDRHCRPWLSSCCWTPVASMQPMRGTAFKLEATQWTACLLDMQGGRLMIRSVMSAPGVGVMADLYHPTVVRMVQGDMVLRGIEQVTDGERTMAVVQEWRLSTRPVSDTPGRPIRCMAASWSGCRDRTTERDNVHHPPVGSHVHRAAWASNGRGCGPSGLKTCCLKRLGSRRLDQCRPCERVSEGVSPPDPLPAPDSAQMHDAIGAIRSRGP
jgi:hypothetical protein